MVNGLLPCPIQLHAPTSRPTSAHSQPLHPVLPGLLHTPCQDKLHPPSNCPTHPTPLCSGIGSLHTHTHPPLPASPALCHPPLPAHPAVLNTNPAPPKPPPPMLTAVLVLLAPAAARSLGRRREDAEQNPRLRTDTERRASKLQRTADHRRYSKMCKCAGLSKDIGHAPTLRLENEKKNSHSQLGPGPVPTLVQGPSKNEFTPVLFSSHRQKLKWFVTRSWIRCCSPLGHE